MPVAAGALYVLGRSDSPKRAEFNVREVVLAEAQALIAAGALVLDVRQRAAYETKHIAGAILAPVEALSAAIPASLAQARERAIVVYCGDGSTLGPEGTYVLNKAGYSQAVNLKAGIQGWAAAGLPIEQGAGKQA
ncbi:rhodanese-like domain-containing protein [Noviherbaspirillum sp. ST 5-3]